MTRGAEKIRAFRKEQGLTQAGLGLILGVTKQAVQLWESDNRKPDLANFYAMKAVGIPVTEADFLNGETK